MNNRLTMKYLFFTILLFASGVIQSQNELPTGQIEVVKDFEVRLTETKKINIIPQALAIDSTQRRYNYILAAPSPSIQYEVPQLKPLAIEPEKKPAYYPLFAKAGYGNPNSLLAQFSYDHVQSADFGWGVDFNHLSANNKKIPLQRFADSEGRINANYLASPSTLLQGYINGQFENVGFYGVEELPANPDVLIRHFKRYDFRFDVSNEPVKDAAFQYRGLFQYLKDNDDFGSRERTIRLGGQLQTIIGEKEFPVGLKLLSDVTKLKDIDEKTINNILAEPYFRFYAGDLAVQLGGLALLKTNENEILPRIELSYQLFPLFSIFGGWMGEVEKNSFHTLSMMNPYVVTRLDSINNMISRRIFAGFKGVTGILQYEFKGGYTKFERMAFWLQDPDDHEQFYPVYDNGSFVGLEATIQAEVLPYVNLRSGAFTRFYSLDEEEKPWHRPTFGIDAQATYTGGDDNYHLALIFHGENGLPYRTPGGTVTRLDPLLDLNLHGDYYFTDALGAFVQVNNILGNNRERWATYPSFGFNAKAGVMLRM